MLIGTSRYRNRALPDLPVIHNNLLDLRLLLTDADIGIFGESRCEVVHNPATQSALMAPLRAAADEALDVLLVYYAGHGLRHATRDRLYLAVGDTDPEGLPESAVAFEDVAEVLRGSSAKTKVLILDCCYSGLAIGTAMSTVIPAHDIEISGTTTLTSTAANKISHARPGRVHTEFTGVLLEVLRDGHPTPGTPLTVQALYGALRAEMSRRKLPKPKMATTDTSGELTLRREPGEGVTVALPQRPAERRLRKRLSVIGAVVSGVVVLAAAGILLLIPDKGAGSAGNCVWAVQAGFTEVVGRTEPSFDAAETFHIRKPAEQEQTFAGACESVKGERGDDTCGLSPREYRDDWVAVHDSHKGWVFEQCLVPRGPA
nr:caspase family protein [Nocardia transvalensis]